VAADRDGYADIVVNDPYFQEMVGGEAQRRGRLWLIPGGPTLPKTVDIRAAAARTFLADTTILGMFGYT
jgi:hypothetical protein